MVKFRMQEPNPLAWEMSRAEIRGMGYETYLQTEWWIWRRSRFLRTAGANCQACGEIERLVVHHVSYKRIGDERDSDLRVLCNSCHHKVHRFHQQVKKDRRVLSISLKAATNMIVERGGKMPSIPGDLQLRSAKKRKTQKKKKTKTTSDEVRRNRQSKRTRRRNDRILQQMTEPVMSKTGRTRSRSGGGSG